ncbi:helix-turn-helix transcriptional regulator [Denitratisoma oestradiolicum]|uniref:Uncharacterized protein n=1 Tax=Denitratisoma oestradiolicum TaxID=311182 RepID=A0A6S6Y0L5_9PROT|nr:helix-turn-helix transcriptional regulator [Denitratisoma oestradiolicum]TWO79191.1 hypothetical protein CBW56_16020 [Denitratisoma oestradiolicum]CAB1370833.1 conserved protein of unknown function [Denitratisoma oestradiolicum]
MDIEIFSRLTRDWLKLAVSIPPECFRKEALDRLDKELEFSSAWWGTAFTDKAAVFDSYLHRLPNDFVVDWWAISNDWWAISNSNELLEITRQDLGVIIRTDGDHYQSHTSPELLAFGRKYNLASALIAGCSIEDNDLGSFISLYRGANLHPFSPEERTLVQLLVQHLLYAEKLNWQLMLSRQLDKTRSVVALAKANGVLTHAPVKFNRLLLSEFPQWSGNALPPELQVLCSQGSGKLVGRTLIIEASQRKADMGNVIELSAIRRAGSGLTPREETVARAYSTGYSYKEIARMEGLSPSTVRSYLRECYLKLGVRNKVELGSYLEEKT